jgi:hypothetical protein
MEQFNRRYAAGQSRTSLSDFMRRKALEAAEVETPDLATVLSTGWRSAGSRFAAISSALHDADAARGKRGEGGKRKQTTVNLNERRFAHPFFWGGFVYTGS